LNVLDLFKPNWPAPLPLKRCTALELEEGYILPCHKLTGINKTQFVPSEPTNRHPTGAPTAPCAGNLRSVLKWTKSYT